MSDVKYGRLYTESDVQMLLAQALRVDDPATVDVEALVRTLEGEGFPMRFPAAEPQFVLRGQDELALPTIHHYEQLAVQAGCEAPHLRTVEKSVLEFSEFKHLHPGHIKKPDTNE